MRLPQEIHITGELRLSGPLTESSLVELAIQAWHTEEEREKIKSEVAKTLPELVKQGTVFQWSGGRYYLQLQTAGAKPAATGTEGNEMAKKAGRPKKATNDEPQVTNSNGDGDEEDEETAVPEGKFKELKNDGETADAMAIAERKAEVAKSELEIKSAIRRIAVAEYDYAVICREHTKTSEGSSLDDVRAAQKLVDKRQKAVTRASAERREARAAYDAINEMFPQILNRRLPLFDDE